MLPLSKKNCKAYLEVREDDVIASSKEHSKQCFPDEKIESLTVYKTEMKRKALQVNDSPIKIAATSLLDLGSEADQISERSLDSDRRMIQRHRKKHKAPAPQDPPSRQLIPRKFFEVYSKTSRGEQFLLYDDGPEVEDRIVIYASERGLNLILKPSRYW